MVFSHREPDPKYVLERAQTMQKELAGLALDLANHAVASMRLRLQRGVGLAYGGAEMPGYTNEYKKLRSAQGLQTEVRDLSASGQMLGAIHVEGVEVGEDITATIGIQGARNREIALYNQEYIPWFGLNEHDQESIMELAQTALKEILE